MPISSRAIKHGTMNAYNVYKCRCDECKTFKSKYTKSLRERNPGYAKRYYAANTELCRQRTKDWRDRHPEINRKKASDWKKQNRQRNTANVIAWSKQNKEKIAAWNRATRAKRRKAKRFLITQKDWQRLINRYEHRCAYCGTSGALTMEHVVPLIRGGNHSVGNILPVCARCNSSKGGRLLTEWRKSRGDI